jgi:hypothetical protein
MSARHAVRPEVSRHLGPRAFTLPPSHPPHSLTLPPSHPPHSRLNLPPSLLYGPRSLLATAPSPAPCRPPFATSPPAQGVFVSCHHLQPQRIAPAHGARAAAHLVVGDNHFGALLPRARHTRCLARVAAGPAQWPPPTPFFSQHIVPAYRAHTRAAGGGAHYAPELVPPPRAVRQQGGDVQQQQQQQRELEGLVGTANVDWKGVLQTLVARAASAVGAQCPTPQYTVPSLAVRSSSLATVSGCYAPLCDCCPFVLGRCVMGLQAFFVVRASAGTAATVMSCR